MALASRRRGRTERIVSLTDAAFARSISPRAGAITSPKAFSVSSSSPPTCPEPPVNSIRTPPPHKTPNSVLKPHSSVLLNTPSLQGFAADIAHKYSSQSSPPAHAVDPH